MPAFYVQKPPSFPKKPVLWSGLLLSLGVGVAFYFAAALSIEHDADERFRNQASSARYSIAAGVKAYTDVLRGVTSFFSASGHVSRASFHAYVAGLDLPHRFVAIDAITFGSYLTDEQRDGFEQRMRGGPDAVPGFAIEPAERRPEYTVITLIEPLTFADRLGVDLASRDVALRMLAASRDNGSMISSGRPIAVSGHPLHVDLALRLPAYRLGAPLQTAAQRQAAYLGSVGIGLNVQRLVHSALDAMPWHHVRLTLRGANNMPPPAPPRLLFDSQEGAAAGARSSEEFTIVLPIDFNGYLWQARFSAPKAEIYSRFDAFLPWLAMLAGFIGSMLMSVLFHTLASSRLRAIKMAKAMTKELRDSQSKLQLSHHKLRRLAAHADQIKEEERKRIAREIHDDLGQNLLVLRIEADMLATRTGARHRLLHARARSTLGHIDSTIKSVRHIINDLRPTVLDLGLGAAVEWQIAQFRQRSGMVCELIEHQQDIVIDDHGATALFRVLQESLSNILQHAKASMVRVELRQQQGQLTMTISDNGIGIGAHSRSKVGSFGLVGIEERISILGGQCSISGSPKAGSVVRVSVPVSYRPGMADPADAAAAVMAGAAAAAAVAG
ncbi:CHASE domain-containing protein [Rugamonas sp.]|uniref:CHASE domain-containing protein n=1 Tax=Rugamonas sp. TaxID=1926287 RepID=UPI0025E75614|nr:CHASE domain-containing protein [Rugamonas sp.]